MGFPFEIITMLGSTLLSGVMSLWAESRKAKAEEQRLLITRGCLLYTSPSPRDDR